MPQHAIARPKIGKHMLHPRHLPLFLNAFKTVRLVKALLIDRRIPRHRKGFFVATVAGLLLVLLFPDLINEAILSTLLPVVGTIIGIPLDIGFDWIALSLVSVQLLRYFPSEVVSEHYTQIFGHKHHQDAPLHQQIQPGQQQD